MSFLLNIYYVKQEIEDIEESKTCIYKVFIYFEQQDVHQMVLEYSYYMQSLGGNNTYSLNKNNVPLNVEMIQKYTKVERFFCNLKSLLTQSFMHNNIYFSFIDYMKRNNFYVEYNENLCSKELWLPWNTKYPKISIDNIIRNLKKFYNNNIAFNLYIYNVNQKTSVDKDVKQNIYMFKHIEDLTKIECFSCENNFDAKYYGQNFCLQICLSKHGYTQFYYLFIPFNDLSSTASEEEARLILVDFLNKRKILIINEKNRSFASLVNCVIEEIKKIQNIPVEVVLRYYYQMQNEELNYFIYSIIAIKLINFGYYKDVYDTFTDVQMEEFKKMKINYDYNEISMLKDFLYNKMVIESSFLNNWFIFRCIVSECLYKTAKKLLLGSNMNAKKSCYIHCGSVYSCFSEENNIIGLFQKNTY